MSLSSRNVIAAAKLAHKIYPEDNWRAFFHGFMEGFGWMLTHKTARDAARLLAYILDAQPVSLTRKDRMAVEKVIYRQFPNYDPDVAKPWPACLGERKGTA